MPRKMTPEQLLVSALRRLWARREVDPNTGCWLYARAKTNGESGYGLVGYGHGKYILAHRLVAWVFLGLNIDDPEEFSLHSCDTPACFNPDHLFVGDHQANMQDMMAKGRDRHVTGGAHHAAKLNDEQAANIKARLVAGERHCNLARMFDVSDSTIDAIAAGTVWRHVPWPTPPTHLLKEEAALCPTA